MDHEENVGQDDRHDLKLCTPVVFTHPQPALIFLFVGRKNGRLAVLNDGQGMRLADPVLAGRPTEPDLHPPIVSDTNQKDKGARPKTIGGYHGLSQWRPLPQ